MYNYTQIPQGLYTVHKFLNGSDYGCPYDEGNSIRDIRIAHYLRSLVDYDTKLRTFHGNSKIKYRIPLLFWFAHDRNNVYDDSVMSYHCRVREIISQAYAIEKAARPLVAVQG